MRKGYFFIENFQLSRFILYLFYNYISIYAVKNRIFVPVTAIQDWGNTQYCNLTAKSLYYFYTVPKQLTNHIKKARIKQWKAAQSKKYILSRTIPFVYQMKGALQ